MTTCDVCNGSGVIVNRTEFDDEPDFETPCFECGGSGEK